MSQQTHFFNTSDPTGLSSQASFSVASAFAPYSKHVKKQKAAIGLKSAVIYTRVSSKEQADKNQSLEVQRKVIEDYAERAGFSIANYFGGTHESAKTDERKEFSRMLAYVKKNKGRVSHILVYALDRFSRSGGPAIMLADQLRNEYGVTVFSVTQPVDTSNATGILQETLQLGFARMDNDLRRQRTIDGMKEQLLKGIWCIKPPIGYDVVRVNGERRIVVNETGEKLRKAFIWKSEGMKNEVILKKLKAMGIRLYKQKLSQMFDNPFYCGIISHSLLEGKLVEGTHEKLISQELFLSIQGIRKSNGGKLGVAHKKEQEELPLKTFVLCDRCGSPLTGYIVKSKGLYYYKCRTTGCRINKSAVKLNEAFADFLGRYKLHASLLAPLHRLADRMLQQRLPSRKDEEKILAGRLKEVCSRIEKLEERYYIEEEMSKSTFDRLMKKYQQERIHVEQAVQENGVARITLDKQLTLAVERSSDMKSVWISGSLAQKEKLQRLVFPSAISYSHAKGALSTKEVSSAFERPVQNQF